MAGTSPAMTEERDEGGVDRTLFQTKVEVVKRF